MPSRNNRRRVLAFLGLIGAPAALWSTAHAEDTYVPITCESKSGTVASEIVYRGYYHIVDGRLTTSDPSGHYMEQAALKSKYSKGTALVKRPVDATISGFNVRAPNFRIDNPDRQNEAAPSFSAILQIPEGTADINGRLKLADGTTEDAYVKFYNPTEENGLTQIDTSWTSRSALLLTKPLTVELIGDGKSLATFTFDMSKVKWQPVIAAEDKRIAAASGVTYDATYGTTTVDKCTSAGTMGGCFFTTAAVETLGLSDDCWELRSLRAFRDGPLAETAEGRALTARYYAEAPRLVEGVNRRRDAARQWLLAYWRHVVPCAVMARLGLHAPAIAHYRRLFDRLERLAA